MERQQVKAKKEFKIGEVFQLGFIKLKAVKYDMDLHPCLYCFIGGLTSDCRVFKQLIGECIGLKRRDKTDVIFVNIEE